MKDGLRSTASATELINSIAVFFSVLRLPKNGLEGICQYVLVMARFMFGTGDVRERSEVFVCYDIVQNLTDIRTQGPWGSQLQRAAVCRAIR